MKLIGPAWVRRRLPPTDRSSAALKLSKPGPLARSNEPLPPAGNRNATTTFIPMFIAAVTPTGTKQQQ